MPTVRAAVAAALFLAFLGAGCIVDGPGDGGGIQVAATSCSTGGRAAGGRGGAAGMGGGGAAGAGGIPGTGGAVSTGGSAMAGNGGSAGGGGAGGMIAGTGGAALGGNGGAAGAGGTIAGTGGTVGTGGAPGTGGAMGGAGGSAGAGGAAGSGGAPSACWGADFGGAEPFYNAGLYATIASPVATASYFAPGLVRVWGHCPETGNTFCSSMDVLLDGAQVTTITPPAGQTDYYQADLTGVPAGCHTLQVRAHFSAGRTALSVVVPIQVVDGSRPAAQTMVLTHDVVLSGSADYDLVGTPGTRLLVTSTNGSRIIDNGNFSGHFNAQYVDFVGLGSMNTAGVQVSTSSPGGITVNGSVFDRCGPPAWGVSGAAPLSFTNNTLAPNMLVTVDSSPNLFNSQPSVSFSGRSTGAKVFSGNNIGVSFAWWFHGNHWTIGGATSEQGNVAIGVRAGVEIDDLDDVVIRGNVFFHRYPFGGSQGMNVAFGVLGTQSPSLVEHNFIRGGSWLVDSFTGEARYNLLMDGADEAFFRGCRLGSAVHHNVFATVGYTRQFNPSNGFRDCDDASFDSNTVDGGGTLLAVAPGVAGVLDGRTITLWDGTGGTFFDSARDAQRLTSVKRNIFTGFGFFNPLFVVSANTLGAGLNVADFNAFDNREASPVTNVMTYAQAGQGAHDLPTNTPLMLAGARQVPFQVPNGALWQRAVTVGQVLATYRSIYTPGVASPLVDAGGSPGVDIGAVGAGAFDPADLFGKSP